MIPVIFLMGATCSGKTSFLDFAQKQLGESLFTFSVGRALREKYPAEYFKGQAAPDHTADEAWKLLYEAFERGFAQPGVGAIMFDGQPRRASEVHRLFLLRSPFVDMRFVMFHASAESRRKRIEGRFPLLSREKAVTMSEEERDNETAEIIARRRLAEERITKDAAELLDVFGKLVCHGEYVLPIDTNGPPESYSARLLNALLSGPDDPNHVRISR